MKKWRSAVLGVSVAVSLIVAATAIFMFMVSGPAAKVNGIAIPRSDIDKEFANYKQRQPALFSGSNGKEQEKYARAAIVEMLIDAELTRQEAEKAGVKVSEKTLRARLEQVKKAFPNPGQYALALKKQGLTEAGLRDRLQNELLAEQMLLRVSGPQTIKDAEVKEFYEKNKTRLFAEANGPGQRPFAEVKGEIKLLLSRQRSAAWLKTVKKKANIFKAVPD